MKADLLRQSATSGSIDINQAGDWHSHQNPVSGEIERIWAPITDDDPDTPEIEAYSIDCIVRSQISYTGTRTGGGASQKFAQDYTNIEFARMQYPPNITLTQRDRVTNIRSKDGLLWRDEELEHGAYRATVFDIVGVIPVVDPFGNHIENMALLARSEVQ